MYSVSIIENNRFVRSGLELILKDADGFTLSGSYCCWEEAFNDSALCQSHVALVAFKLPDMSTIQGLHRLTALHPHLLSLVFAAPENDAWIIRAICAGAVGFINIHAAPRELLDTLKLVCEGGSPISPAIARYVLSLSPAVLTRRGAAALSLTATEMCVLQNIALGRSLRTAAHECSLTMSMLYRTVRRIYRRIQQEHK